jgi:hypothetical protein
MSRPPKRPEVNCRGAGSGISASKRFPGRNAPPIRWARIPQFPVEVDSLAAREVKAEERRYRELNDNRHGPQPKDAKPKPNVLPEGPYPCAGQTPQGTGPTLDSPNVAK